MRNLIIDSKVQREGKISIRKTIVTWIYQFVAGYFGLVVFWFIFSSFASQRKESEDKQASESKNKGKNKKEKENWFIIPNK